MCYQSLQQDMRRAALNWLARRDYTTAHIQQKLEQTFAASLAEFNEAVSVSGGEDPARDPGQHEARQREPGDVPASQRAAPPEPDARAGADSVIAETLAWLQQHNFLNDRRFCEVFVRARIDRGHGLLRIRQDIKQKGIDDTLLGDVLEQQGPDWFSLAVAARQRRFGLAPCRDAKEKARQLRFLQYRGFSADQCFYALNTQDDSDTHPLAE